MMVWQLTISIRNYVRIDIIYSPFGKAGPGLG